MAKVLVTESHLEDIADAIRGKLGVQTRYKPGQMAGAIGNIHGEPVLQSKTATQNGTVTPDTGYDGLSNVTVNVPNTYTASDEGKVVSNGALVAQTSRSVTLNGTYDTTENDEVVVNVPSGGVTKIEMNSCQQECYLYNSGNRGWAVYPSTPGAQGSETFYADIPQAYQNGGMIVLSTECPSGASYEFTRNRIGFTSGAEDPDDLPDGQNPGITTQPEFYMNAMSQDKTKQFSMVRVPNGMTRVYWTNTQSSYRVAGQKSYMWLISDSDFLAALNINWKYYISNSINSEGTTSAWPL